MLKFYSKFFKNIIFLFDWQARVQANYPVWRQVLFLTMLNFIYIIIPCHYIVAHYIMVGYCDFMLEVRVSIRPSFCPSVRFSSPDDNLSKHQWIFTEFGMCIDIVKIWFGIANGQI